MNPSRVRPSLRAALGALATLWCVASPVLSQEPQRLEDLQRRFAEERDELIRSTGGRVEFEQVRELAKTHADALSQWLEKNAGSPDATDARLMLTNIFMDVGDQDRAGTTLQELDLEKASALQLAAAAEMAQYLGIDDARERWIEAAIGKEANLEERMALAMFLMTRLVEVERGEAIFTTAQEAATDDEQRAEIAFHRAAAISMREDLPDGSYETALDELGEKYPNTYWGDVAKARVAALALEVGSPAIPVSGATLDGGELTLTDCFENSGQVVLLDFWNTASVRDRRIPTTLKALRDEFGERGLRLVGVNLDPDAELATRTVATSGMDWTHLFDGKGWKSDAALRYAVETVPYQILIGADGKVAALRIFLLDDFGKQELRDAITAALAKKDG